MKESVTIAMEYLKAHATDYNLSYEIFENGMFMYMFQRGQHLKMVHQLELQFSLLLFLHLLNVKLKKKLL